MQRVRGTKDFSPSECNKNNKIIQIAKSLGEKYGFNQIDIPIIEYEDLFISSLGKNSEIINKQIYSFLDKSNKKIALRPEFTAGVMRYITTNNIITQNSLRFFLTGALFRYDRPQKGRQRQFHQINFEHVNTEGPISDAQVIKLAYEILKSLGIASKVTLQINSLGSKSVINEYEKALFDYLEDKKNLLSEDSQIKLHHNPLRILDSKVESDQSLLVSAPNITSYYTEECLAHFELVKRYLNLYSIPFKINNNLVRGLDYYCDTVFEFTTKSLGSQSAIFAGGRYNYIHNIELPAVGCAAGVERISLLLDDDFNKNSNMLVIIIPLEGNFIEQGIELFKNLETISNIKLIIETEGNLKRRMKKSNFLKASYVILIGEDEIKKNVYKLRKLKCGKEKFFDLKDLKKYFINKN